MSQQSLKRHTREELKELILQNWDIIEEIHNENNEECMKVEQCNKCKKLFNSNPDRCLLTMCMWCEKKSICYSCCTEVFYYSDKPPMEEGFCTNKCLNNYFEDQEIQEFNL